MIRNLRSFVLILALFSVTEMFGQEPVEPLDPNQPLVLVFSTGDWTWARALKRMGPVLEYYKLSGQYIRTERYLSLPVENVDFEATAEVNAAIAELGAICAEGNAHRHEFELSERASKVFEQAGQGAVFIGEHGRKLEGCFEKMMLGQRMRRIQRVAAQRTPQPAPPPRVTPTLREIESAQAELRTRCAQKWPSLSEVSIVDEWVDPVELNIDAYYLLSRDTPFVDDPNPSDPLEAIGRMESVSSGRLIYVQAQVNDNDGISWYRVCGPVAGYVKKGYINRAALFGQDLKRVIE